MVLVAIQVPQASLTVCPVQMAVAALMSEAKMVALREETVASAQTDGNLHAAQVLAGRRAWLRLMAFQHLAQLAVLENRQWPELMMR